MTGREQIRREQDNDWRLLMKQVGASHPLVESQGPLGRTYRRFESLLAELEQAEWERDEARADRDKLAYLRGRPTVDEWNHQVVRLSRAEQQADKLAEALRPFAEKWDLHAADYLAELIDGEEHRVLPARVIAEMTEDIKNARAALAEWEAK